MSKNSNDDTRILTKIWVYPTELCFCTEVIIENQSTHLDNPSIMTAAGDQQSK